MHATGWEIFIANGERSPGTKAHVVWGGPEHQVHKTWNTRLCPWRP